MFYAFLPRARVNCWTSIGEHLIVCGQQTKAFVSRLDYQKAIERISVAKFECFYSRSVVDANRKRLYIVRCQPSSDVRRNRLR